MAATAKDRCCFLACEMNNTTFEDNGQWLECHGRPYFCPDNSPDPYDYLYDDDVSELDSELDSESKTEYQPIKTHRMAILKLVEFYDDDIDLVDYFTEPPEPDEF